LLWHNYCLHATDSMWRVKLMLEGKEKIYAQKILRRTK